MDLTKINHFNVEDFKLNPEASEYKGCSYRWNNFKIIQRSAKITPTKTGQFVTLWKRNENGETCPLDANDEFDFVIVLAEKKECIGRFLFSKKLLIEKLYIGSENQQGKRGFRVYPDWDEPSSKQALKTQSWQNKFFKRTLTIDVKELLDLKS